jgi:hypothetical protein
MTWEPGMIAVRVTTEGSTAFGKRVIPVGSRVVVKRFMARGELSLDFGRRLVGDALFFDGIPDRGPESYGYIPETFRPLDDGDIQGLREKYGVSVSGKKERAE